MSKMSNLSLVLDELIGCGEALIRTANALKESLVESESQEKVIAADKKNAEKKAAATKTDSVKPEETVPETVVPAAPITKEAVRAVLAAKSSAGFKSQVKELLGKFGATQLKQVKPEDYAALLAEAEKLGNAEDDTNA